GEPRSAVRRDLIGERGALRSGFDPGGSSPLARRVRVRSGHAALGGPEPATVARWRAPMDETVDWLRVHRPGSSITFDSCRTPTWTFTDGRTGGSSSRRAC